MFGKCNNPSWHGHNYRVEPAVDHRPRRPVVGDLSIGLDDGVVTRDGEPVALTRTEFRLLLSDEARSEDLMPTRRKIRLRPRVEFD